MDVLLHDLRHAIRALRRKPGFAAVAVITLALGIGAATTMFSVINGVVLRPLPYPNPDRLVMLWEHNPERGWSRQSVAPANFLDWRERVGAFADVTAHLDWGGLVLGDDAGEPAFVGSTWVFGNFFDVLGVRPALGRSFEVEESWAGGDMVVILSDALWRNRFAADSGIVGRTIRIDGAERVVVGIMPPGFAYPSPDVDVWLPIGWAPASRTAPWFRRAHFARAVARLRPGVSLETARHELGVVAQQLEREHPATNRAMGAGLTDLRTWIVGDAKRYLMVTFGAVAVLLLIACVNVANLFLARVTDRRHELVVRSALGASRLRLALLPLLESLTVAGLGGVLGIALGTWGTEVFLAVAIADVPRLEAIRIDLVVLGFAVLATAVTAVLFGTGPAVLGSSASSSAALSESGRAVSAGRRSVVLRRTLVAVESALAVLLIAGAGLMLRTLQQLGRVDPGFDPASTVAATVQLPTGKYRNGNQVLAFHQDLLSRLEALPGVEEAGSADGLPLQGSGWTSDFAIEGEPPFDQNVEFNRRVVTPGYFEALRVPLLRGRLFNEADGPEAPRVILINETLARLYFRGADPVGRRIAFARVPDADQTWYTVAGVVGAEKVEGLGSTREWPEIFLPTSQAPQWRVVVVVRSPLSAGAVVTGVRSVLRDVDPDLALAEVRTMQAVLGESVARERFVAALLGAFAALALGLAAIGIYGVISYLVVQREREIGIRVALGATQSAILRVVVGQGMAIVGIGLGVGMVAAIAVTRLMRSLLFGVTPTDPITFVAAVVLLGGTALLACYLPARRAASIAPTEALRHE